MQKNRNISKTESDEKQLSNFLSCPGFLWCIQVGLEKSVLLPLQIPFLLLRVTHISTLINSGSGAQAFGSSPALILAGDKESLQTPLEKIALTLALVIWLGLAEFSLCAAPRASAWGRLMRGMTKRSNSHRGLEPRPTFRKQLYYHF